MGARPPSLEDLGLPDYTPVEAVFYACKNKPPSEQRSLRGLVIEGMIEVEAPGAPVPVRRVDPRGFVAAAGYTRQTCRLPYLHIKLEGGVTLAQRAKGEDKSEKQRIAGWLESKCGGPNLGRLFQYVKAHPIKGTVFRVCRLDEKEIHLKGVTSNSSLRPWWRPAEAAATPAIDFLQQVNSHIRNGSKVSHTRQPFISATSDLRAALSWGYGGCHTIVAIDVAKAAAAGVHAFDMGGSLNDLCWAGMAQNFAASSAEVVFDYNIPADCVDVLKVDWYPMGDRILSSSSTADAQLFPQTLRLEHIEVLKELEDGTSKPLKVEVALVKEGGRKPKPAAKQKADKETAKHRAFVLKRCGGAGGTARSAHIVSEFTAMAMYARAGLKVPRAALYTVKVAVVSANVEVVVKYLLVEWLEGRRPSTSDFISNERLLRQFEKGIALDVALSNADAAGPSFSNLLVVDDQLYRIDQGGCGFFDYVGKRKPLFLFEQTNRSDLERTFAAMKGQDGGAALAASVLAVSGTALGGSDTIKADEALALLVNINTDLAQLAWDAKQLGPRLRTDLLNWLASDRTGLSETLVDTVTRTLARLAALERCSYGSGRQSQPRGTAHSLQDIAVVKKSRAATVLKHCQQLGYTVWDVTAEGEHSRLSPFYGIGEASIQVPGQPEGTTAKSLEGVWQGLKVFDGYLKHPQRDVDHTKFDITSGNPRDLKRKFPVQVMGHAWHGENGEEPRKLLKYLEAREMIYLPVFHTMVETVWVVRQQVIALADAATKNKIALLDYYTNGDIKDETEPLSHAALLRQYVQDNWRGLLGLPEPQAAAGVAAAAAAAAAAAVAPEPAGMPAARQPPVDRQDEGPETSAAAAARAPLSRSAPGRPTGSEATPAAQQDYAAHRSPSHDRPSAASVGDQVFHNGVRASALHHHEQHPDDVLPAPAAEVLTGEAVAMREQVAGLASQGQQQRQRQRQQRSVSFAGLDTSGAAARSAMEAVAPPARAPAAGAVPAAAAAAVPAPAPAAAGPGNAGAAGAAPAPDPAAAAAAAGAAPAAPPSDGAAPAAPPSDGAAPAPAVTLVPKPGVYLLASVAVEDSEAAAIIAAGGPDGGWLLSEQVKSLLSRYKEWGLRVSSELKEGPTVGDMLLLTECTRYSDGLDWKKKEDKKRPFTRERTVTVEGAKVKYTAYFSTDDEIERRVYSLDSGPEPKLKLLHYHHLSEEGRQANSGPASRKRKAPEPGDGEQGGGPPNQQEQARPGAGGAAAAAAASARDSGEGSNAPGTDGASGSGSGAAADAAEAASPSPAAAAASAAPAPAAAAPAAAAAGSVPAPAAAGRAPAARPAGAAAAAGVAPAAPPSDGAAAAPAAATTAAAAAAGLLVAAGVYLLASEAVTDPLAAAIIAAGGPDGGWLLSEQVQSLLSRYEDWGLRVSPELRQQPTVGDMLLTTRSRFFDGLEWQTEQRGGQPRIWQRTRSISVNGAVVGEYLVYRTTDGTIERRAYRLNNGPGPTVRLLHYHNAPASGGPQQVKPVDKKRKAPDGEDDGKQARELPGQHQGKQWAGSAAAAAAAGAGAGEGSNAPGTRNASGSGAAADAAGAPASTPAAAAGAGAAAGVHLLSAAAAANKRAGAIIALGGPDGGWLSGEQVQSLITYQREWGLPISSELKQQPQVGDMMLVSSRCVSNRISDGLIWEMEPRSNGQQWPLRRAAYFAVKGTNVGTCSKYFTADGTIERRVYKLSSAPDLRLLHYHNAPEGGRKTQKRKAPEAGGAGQAAPKEHAD